MTLFETDRLFIGHAQLQDRKFIFDLLNSPTWMRFIGDRGIKNLDAADHYIKNSLISSYKLHGFGLYKVTLKETGKPIGICGFLKRDFLPHVDLGFAMLPMHEGKGYTFEAAKRVLTQATSDLNFKTILAITSAENVKSQGLLKKLGFRQLENHDLQGKAKSSMLFSYSQPV